MTDEEFEKRKTMQFKRPKLPPVETTEDDETTEFSPDTPSKKDEDSEFDARETGTFRRIETDDNQ